MGYMQFKKDKNDKQINEKIIYANIIDGLNEQVLNRYSGSAIDQEGDYTAFVNRFYGNKIGIKEKYRLLTFFMKDQKNLISENRYGEADFLNTNVKIAIETNFNYYAEDEKKLDLKLHKKSLKNRVRKFQRIGENITESTLIESKDIKQVFILGFLEDYIYESFNVGVLRDIENKNEQIIETQKIIDDLYGNKELYENRVLYLLEIIRKINENYFTSKEIIIPLNHDEEVEVINLVNILDKYIAQKHNNNLDNNIKVIFENLSEGENEFLNIFAKIRESLKNSYVKYGDTVILLLDEPDKSFHPEWARKFIPILLKNINRLENVETKYQIIISTHSPFMVSDVPSNNLILLESTLNENNEKRCIVKRRKNIGKTFANNIHTILSNEFFIKSTIGEFSRTKIQESIKYMMAYKKCKNNKAEDILNEFLEPNLSKMKKKIKYIIDIIGEPVIKRKLEELFLTSFVEDSRDLKKEITQLQKEKNKLEELLKDKGLDNIENIIELLNNKIKELKDKVDVKDDINKMQ